MLELLSPPWHSQVTPPARRSRSYAVPTFVTDGRGLAASTGIFCVLLVDQTVPAHLLVHPAHQTSRPLHQTQLSPSSKGLTASAGCGRALASTTPFTLG
jgi:hypothetical protein